MSADMMKARAVGNFSALGEPGPGLHWFRQARVCAWCGKTLTPRMVQSATPPKTSHGICPECEAKEHGTARDVTEGRVP